jgi:type IV pilus assembly protein PilA
LVTRSTGNFFGDGNIQAMISHFNKEHGTEMTARISRNYFLRKCIAIATVLLFTSICGAQAVMPGSPASAWAKDLKNYPGLNDELGRLFARLKNEVQTPPVRGESKLLPLLPNSTLYYAAFPNYGDAAGQVLNVFRQELQQSAALRDWWQHGEFAANGPIIEQSIDKLSQLSQYLGAEIVVSGDGGLSEGKLLLIAQVRKPGLKQFLQEILKENSSKWNSNWRVLDSQELAKADDQAAEHGIVVLVRPDLVIAGLNVAALRSFDSLLQSNNRQFALTSFGQRLTQAYQRGASILVAADLQNLMTQVPMGAGPQQELLARTGFGDMKYLVWEHKSVAGQAASQTELSFNGPRHGVASWLAAPAPMNSLTFVSPGTVASGTILFKNFAQIFDDIKDLSTYSNPRAWASFDQMQQAMNINLRQDLLSQLDGEVTLDLEKFTLTEPVWKVILRVNNPQALQQSFDKLMQAAPIGAEQSEEAGIAFHTLHIPSAKKVTDIVYAFTDGYMIVAPSHQAILDAIQAHHTGESLANSPRLLTALPSGYSRDASALLYEDPIAISSIALRQASPEMAEAISRLSKMKTSPVVVTAYGEESSIKEASTTAGADTGVALVMAAIAIPNLLRAKIAANEASAAATIRTINTAEIIYASTYPKKGFAADLAALGPDPRGASFVSARHASVISADLGNTSCVSGAWCTKSGFQFTLKAVCGQSTCRDFVVVGTPVSSSTGLRSFCSTSDGIVRFKLGSTLEGPITVSQCRTWLPLQ